MQVDTMADETEQQLREKIASQRSFIANLPTLRSIVDETGLTSPETKARAQLIKDLSDNEEQLELLLESKRVAAVVRLQDELHPPLDSEDCPICLETIKHVNNTTIVRFGCCGGWVCQQCGNEHRAKYKAEGFDEMFRCKCPFCREEMLDANDHKKQNALILKHANNGMAWAQAYIGSWYFNGKNGFSVDKEKGLKFIEQAADQRYPGGIFDMALVYNEENLERDESKYVYYLKEAANLGHQNAQLLLSAVYRNEDEKHVYYITLAASQGDAKACSMLGHYFLNAKFGLPKSFILAKHYAEKRLYDEVSNVVVYACDISIALLQLGKERFGEVLEIPGHSPIPKSLFWLRKALEHDSAMDEATEIISMIENQVKSRCTNCRKEAGCSSFKRCTRCLGAWYCGKECQVQHWKAGHKFDCIKS